MLDKWFQIKILSTIKLHNFSRSVTFVLVASACEILKHYYIPTYDYATYSFSWY